jgi:hypothetical protein
MYIIQDRALLERKSAYAAKVAADADAHRSQQQQVLLLLLLM